MFISLKQNPPPVTDRDHISLLLPTRGRPQMLAQVFASLEQTIAQKNKVAVWLYIDHDDQLTMDAIQTGQFKGYSFGIHWVVGESAASLGEIHNLTWRACHLGFGHFHVARGRHTVCDAWLGRHHPHGVTTSIRIASWSPIRMTRNCTNRRSK